MSWFILVIALVASQPHGWEKTGLTGSPHELKTSGEIKAIVNSTTGDGNKSSLLFNQEATGYYQAHASQWDSVYPFEAEFADNFSLSQTFIIDSLTWWGNYWNGTPGGLLGFRIKIYEDSIGYNMPKTEPIYIARVSSFSETDLGGYYKYGASIPDFLALAGHTYWIVFQAVLIYPPQWGVNGSWPANTPGWGDGQQGYMRFPLLNIPNWTPANDIFGHPIESSFQIFGSNAQPSIIWDFETGPQGWTHTNGEPFPRGWAVRQSNHRSDWMCPEPGDSSFWIDSDIAGTVPVSDTAYSPAVIPPPSLQYVKFGYSFNSYSGNERYAMGIRVFSGGSWSNPIQLKLWTTDTGPAWDSVNISTYSSVDSIKVYFAYTNANWDWYAAFDNVELKGLPTHDVGVHTITSPGSRVFPGVPVNVSAIVKNYGISADTVHLTVTIDSAGTNILTETSSFNLDSGSEIEYTLSSPWTPSRNSGVQYTITFSATTNGDLNISNDTKTMTVRTDFWTEWERCSDMPSPLMCHASTYDSLTDKIYVFGGYAGGSTYYNYTFEYNPETNSWSTKSPMPYSVDWINASYINGNIYILGGYDGSIRNYNLIYNTQLDSWSVGTPVPYGRAAGAQCVYKDSLIYFIGGYDGTSATSIVQIYDTYTDSWTTGTSMPDDFLMGKAVITGDTIWVIGGGRDFYYNLYSTLYLGVINPNSPNEITWTSGASLPVPTFLNGAATITRDGNRYLYLIGGFENTNPSTHAYEYSVSEGIWNTLPNYPSIIVRNDFLVARATHNELYVLGGDNTGSWTPSNEVWKLHWGYTPIEENAVTYKSPIGFAKLPVIVRNATKLSYFVGKSGRVSLILYDASGRLINIFVNDEVKSPGEYVVTIKTQDEKGKAMKDGVYFLRLSSEHGSSCRKIFITK